MNHTLTEIARMYRDAHEKKIGLPIIPNPEGVPTQDPLKKISIAGEIYKIAGGGGEGGTSDYEDLDNKPSINNVELSGDKSLTDLGINIPTKVSDLSDADDYAKSEDIPSIEGLMKEPTKEGTNGQVLSTDGVGGRSWIDIPESGTEVSANPEITDTDPTLTSIKIGDNKYKIEGGGTEVEANPAEEATDDLKKIKISNIIYQIPDGITKIQVQQMIDESIGIFLEGSS